MERPTSSPHSRACIVLSLPSAVMQNTVSGSGGYSMHGIDCYDSQKRCESTRAAAAEDRDVSVLLWVL